MIPSNVLSNLEKLKMLLKKEPKATHVYMEREDGTLVDIPLANVEFEIRNKPKWLVDSVAVSGVPYPGSVNPWPAQKISDIGKKEAAAAEAAPVELPPKPSEEKKDEGTASSGNAASPDAAGTPAAPEPPAPVAPVAPAAKPATPAKPAATTRKK